ncbi:hypothetical protein COCNU_04G001330 [Cocos nucifera]|uniref:Myb/SANT-like domain-containing protein n=1 Tax=Cocos nucifera TaxID=13894 RepID=A0A8K0I530_COCNU|nr:hypothetical protein COCNU_04G001330 [Cocos nucifera]
MEVANDGNGGGEVGEGDIVDKDSPEEWVRVGDLGKDKKWVWECKDVAVSEATKEVGNEEAIVVKSKAKGAVVGSPKEKFGVVYDIFKGYNGFSWSLLTKRFEAKDEVKPNASKWKYTEIQNYDKLYDLFAKDRATSKGAVSAREKVQQWEANFMQNVMKDGVENNNNEGYSPQSPNERTSQANPRIGASSTAEAIKEATSIAEKGLLIAERGVAIAEKVQKRIAKDEVFHELLKIDVPEHELLDEKFGVVYDIFKGYNGFSWSLLTKRFEAKDEVKPNASKWKYTEIQNYDKLYDLFAKDRATSKGAVSAREKVQQWEANFMQNVMKDGVENNNNEGYSPQSPNERTSQANPRIGASSTAEAIKEATSIAEKGLLIAERGVAIAEKVQKRIAKDEVFHELLKIDVPEHELLDVFLFLIKSQQKIRAFSGVPKELLSKMTAEAKDP